MARLKYLLSTVAMILILYSFSSGPAQSMLQDYTGSPASSGTCNNAGCHAGGLGTTLIHSMLLEDTATHQIMSGTYTPGAVYKVHLWGSNSSKSYSKFGFQATVLKTADQSQAGNLFPLVPSQNQVVNVGGAEVVEHSKVLDATNDTMKAIFLWQAPAGGQVSLYAIFNAVDNSGSPGGDQVSLTHSVVLNDLTASIHSISKPKFWLQALSEPGKYKLNCSMPVSEDHLITFIAIDGRTLATAVLPKSSESISIALNQPPNGIFAAVIRSSTIRDVVWLID